MRTLYEKIGYVPRMVVWELTLRCNLQCWHCGSRAGRGRQDELSPAEALALAHQVADLGCKYLTLSGGEPLMRADWPEIAEVLVSRGVVTSMISNGILWTEETARTVKRVGLESVGFSLDGFRESHEHQRRVPGQWQRVLDTIRSCHAAGINTSVVTTINRLNLAELEELRGFLRELGVTRWQLQFGTPTGNMSDHPELVILPEDVLTAVPLIAKMSQDSLMPRVYPGHDVGYFGEPEAPLRAGTTAAIPFWTGCPAGCSVMGIESNGNIKGCLSLPSERNGVEAFVEGNVRQRPLEEIWKDRSKFAYNRAFEPSQLGGFCRDCPYAEVCRGGCTWTVYTEGGFVRDNAYCYYRQSEELKARGGTPPSESRVRLPILSE